MNSLQELSDSAEKSAEFFTCLSSTEPDARIRLLSEQHISSPIPEQPTVVWPAA